MRVEDLDRARLVEGAEARILDDLRWLGLTWDEGPDIGGDYGPYRQSEKLVRFGELVAQLLSEDKAYPCFCSRKEIALAAVAPHGPSDDGPRYPGTCSRLTSAQRAAKAKLRPPSIRLRVERGEIGWHDRLSGEHSDNVLASVGDFVLRRADLVPAYQLAVAIDDGEMRISDVVRADDLLTSTARQILMYQALGWRPPRFLHVPLVLGPDGARLSKRHGAIGVGAMRARGFAPEALIGCLAATLGLVPTSEPRSAASLVEGFDASRIGKTPTRLDLTTLAALP